MSSTISSLQRWVAWVSARAWLCMTLLCLLTVGLGWVAVTQFRINSDLNKLITQQAPWREDFDRFEEKFPQLVRTAVVVVSGESLKQVEIATARAVAYLHAKPQVFADVAAPGSEGFFRDHAFLYMDVDALDDMADRLAEAQPWLTTVAEDPSLRGVLRLVGEGLGNDPPAGFATVIDLLAQSAQQALAGADATVWWTDELFDSDDARYQLIYVKPQTNYENALPDAKIIAELREMVAVLDFPAGVRVHLTGELTLQHEELEAAVSGVTMAGWLAVVLLFLVLVVGVRSAKIILATFGMLAMGIVWTSAYAMIAVGEYNTLSLVFLVMFFGLGVDFALHFSLRFQEAINRGSADVTQALVASTGSVGRAISLCSLTTAIGFLGFWPTDYQGLADLGVISAGGMVIAWFLTFTFLPAFYALCGSPRAHEMDLPTSERVVNWLIGHRPVVIAAVVVVGVLAAVGASHARFDYSVLALKDPESQSMQALRMLQREKLSTDYQLVVVGSQQVDKSALERLDVVDEVRTPADWVPGYQDEKLDAVFDLEQLLWSALNPKEAKPPPHAEALRPRVQELLTRLDAALADPSVAPALSPDVLANFRVQMMGMVAASDEQWQAWQTGVVTNLLDELDWLRRATAVDGVTFEDLPTSIRSRLVAAQGEQLSVITPAQDIAPVDKLSAFISGVRSLEPHATGRPVIEWGVGNIVVRAFQEALAFAIIGITIVLSFAMRRVASVLMILVPLVLAALLTLSLGVVFDMPINMANILVIPLIFGLGVDNGIHVVDRYLGEGDVDHLMHSSTPRAVLLSTMTTIGAFAALSLSPHAGTASIGIVLTVAVGLLLVITVFLLPVLLSVSRRPA